MLFYHLKKENLFTHAHPHTHAHTHMTQEAQSNQSRYKVVPHSFHVVFSGMRLDPKLNIYFVMLLARLKAFCGVTPVALFLQSQRWWTIIAKNKQNKAHTIGASAAAWLFVHLSSKDRRSVSLASRPSCLCFHLTHSARETRPGCLMPFLCFYFFIFFFEHPSIK